MQRYLVLFLAFIILIGVNMIARYGLHSVRLDVTEQGHFTVSDEAISILTSIDEPVTLRFFFTQEQANGLPVFQTYAERIRSLLHQYEDMAGQNITLEFLNPKAFSQEEDVAVAHGVQGIPVDDKGNHFYFGLSVENTTDDRGVIAFFDPSRSQFLEYDIIRLIHEMAQPERKTIGLLSTLPMKGTPDMKQMRVDGEWMILQQMQSQFKVEILPEEVTAIDPNVIDTLMLVHPHDLPDATLYAIDQYIMKGGHLLLMMDAYVNSLSVSDKASQLDVLLDKWGVSVSSDKVAGEKDAAISVQQPGVSRLRTFPNVTWLEMGSSYFSDSSVLTASLEILRMIESGFITQDDNSPLDMLPLITTTPAAMKVPVENLQKAMPVNQLYHNYVPDGEPLILAAELYGTIDSAFGDEKAEQQQSDHVSTSVRPARIVLIADTDMLRNEYWVNVQQLYGSTLMVPSADNGAFILNALDYLTGSDALIAMRGVGTTDRRFDVLDEMKREAESRFRAQEQELRNTLKSMEQRLRELQTQEQQGTSLFTDGQAEEVQTFREAFLETRKKLRQVQRDLNADIEALGMKLAWLNILAIPLVLLILAFVLPRTIRRMGKTT